jgi:protein-L-isoaspartate(D-aspartate) O-methyltransferase
MPSASDGRARSDARTDFDPPRARELRARWVERLDRSGELKSERTRTAFLQVPRHAFIPPALPLEEAYSDGPVPIGCGQTLLAPVVVACMTEALELTGGERVLHVGTGSGYQAALLSELAAEVHTIERVHDLARRAARVLAALGCSNVFVRAGDGSAGWSERAPFDRVIVSAAAERVAGPWLDQLASAGAIVVPLGGAWGGQRLMRYRRRFVGDLEAEDLGALTFVGVLYG